MYRFTKKTAFLFSFLFLYIFSFSQDTTQVYHWKITSTKINDTTYELKFSTEGAKGWQLYSPVQTIPELVTTELKFGDSAITQQTGFSETWIARTVSNSLFE